MTTGDAWVRTNAAYRAVVRGWPERAVLACSGGVDSSALLVLTGIAVRRREVEPFTVVHIDHRTRPEGDAEAEVVERLAARWGLRSIRASVDPAVASSASTSPEDRLRALRYAALARVASDLGVAAVVTAHTRDDQIETILMRLLSGSGGLASSGMTATSTIATTFGDIDVHRPLLDITRRELEDVLRRANVLPLIDPTNADRGFRRNAIRHDIVPLLREAFPGFESALLRTTMLAARDADALDTIASDVATTSLSSDEQRTRIDRAAIRSAHAAIAARIIRGAASRLMPDDRRELTFERVERVRLAADGRTGAVIELPYGVVARVERTAIIFEQRNLSRDDR